jgi:hypothetical protein
MEHIQRVQDSPRGKHFVKNILPVETWTYLEDDLWLGPNGVIVNQAALEERRFYYSIIEVK